MATAILLFVLIISLNGEIIGKKWKSAWLILSSEKYYWFTIDRIYWKRNQTAIEVSDDRREWLETGNYILNYGLTPIIKNCLKALYKAKVEKKWEIISYHSTSAEAELWLQLQIVCNCVCNGCVKRIVSCRFLFDVSLMRSNLLQCLETELTVFPKTSKR